MRLARNPAQHTHDPVRLAHDPVQLAHNPASRARNPSRCCQLLACLTWLLLTLGVPCAWSAGCTVGTSGLNFGNYDVFSALNDDITATVNVNCASGTAYSIWLSPGTGTFAARTLLSGSNSLLYNLYLDPTHLSIWGDGSAGTGTSSGTGTGSDVPTSIYGRIPAGQNAWVGPYTDLITITVNF